MDFYAIFTQDKLTPEFSYFLCHVVVKLIETGKIHFSNFAYVGQTLILKAQQCGRYEMKAQIV